MEDLCKPTKAEKNVVQFHQIRVSPSWMNSIVLFLNEDVLPKSKSEAVKIQGKLLGFSCPRTKSCIRDLFLAHICYAYTLKQLSYSYKNYMKGFVEATRGANLCLTGPSLKAISGQICRRKHKNI